MFYIMYKNEFYLIDELSILIIDGYQQCKFHKNIDYAKKFNTENEASEYITNNQKNLFIAGTENLTIVSV